MSFFDETDEAGTEIRTPSRRSTRMPPRRVSGPGGGGGRRPASQQQQVMIRRAIAIVALVIIIVLIAVGISSCQSNATKTALQNYTQHLNSLIDQSQQTSSSLFAVLTSGAGSSDAVSVQHQINQTAANAQSVLASARKLSVPSSAKTANAYLVQALQLRVDGITGIANNIQPALGTSVTQQAINSIAADMARFYASDVLYKQYAAPDLANALHHHGVDVGGASGETISAKQFLPNVQWLTPTYIESALHVTVPGSASGKLAPGTHGHELNTVSDNGSQLQTSGNTVSTKPAPVFTLNFTNSGVNNETGVTCKVSVTGTSAVGTKVVPETFAGKPATCQVTLSSPPAGTYTVVFTIEKVPGEKVLSNNTLSFPVTFQ